MPSVANMAQPLNNEDRLHTQALSSEGSNRLPLETEDMHYNTRSLSSDDRVIEFEDEIARIKFDIMGINETRRNG